MAYIIRADTTVSGKKIFKTKEEALKAIKTKKAQKYIKDNNLKNVRPVLKK